MLTSLVGILLFGAVILITAFLGSWLALSLNARRTAVPPPKPVAQEAGPEDIAPSALVRPAEPPPVKHAFEFTDEQVTMILEMPIEALADDATLADVWVDAVSWARSAWRDIQEGKQTRAEGLAGEETLDESEITREHLEDSLQRLHDAAERRRELRLKLNERRGDALQSSPEA